jgi:3-methylcrotonyl-CoA carboxylase alpha subunit
MGGRSQVFTLADPMSAITDSGGGGDTVIAPMPGLVTSISVEVGQAVTSGQTLMTIEAMKMEHALTAPRDGVIKEILTTTGQQVSVQARLVELEPVDG